MSQDLYYAGFISGDDNASEHAGPFLQEEILSLNGLEELIPEQVMPVQSATEHVAVGSSPAAQEVKFLEKKPVKPKWFKR